MAQFAKTTFSHASYAAFRPSYPSILYDTILRYHSGSKALCLDLGTGHGLVARSFALHFSQVLGTDPSPGMIEQARSSTPTKDFPYVNFREASAEDLPFLEESSVDMVVAAQAAHWFDYTRLFPEMKRIVRKGGSLAFWAYKDHVFVDFARATDVLNHYAYGESKDLLGPYWSQPGRSFVQSKLRNIELLTDEWEDVQRIEYEPGARGPRSGVGTMFLHKRIKLGDCMNYIRTWSSYHAWQEAHPVVRSRQEGGAGDVIDEMFDEMRLVEPSWQGKGWEEKEVEIEWGTGLLLGRKR